MSKVDAILAFTDTMSGDELASYALRLEELGYDALWLPDLVGRELYATAAFVLGRTSRIRVATGIANVYARDALSTAQAARTLAELYDGRFILGLGVSHPQAAKIHGQEWIAPARKLRSYLEAIHAATPRSPEPAHPAPIYIAAHGPKLLALARELADGANTYLMPPAHTEAARATLGPEKALHVVLPCCMSDDFERARETARRGVRMYLQLPAYHRQWQEYGFGPDDWAGAGSDRLVESLVACGDADAIHRRIDEHIDAGATAVKILPYNPDGRAPDWKLLEAFAPAA
jgi:probable F420-dependent oxidoreductase